MANFSKKFLFSVLFFFLISILIIYRGPCFFYEGIFETNEYEFYKYAKENGFFSGLFFVYKGAYYFKLWTNIANTTASFFEFETAKLITTYFSIIAYYIIFTYIFFFNSNILPTQKEKIFAIFVILFSPGMTPEVWMGSAHIREYFGIFAFVLLFYDPKNDSNLKKFYSNLLIIISILSSVWATVLSPIYFIKFFFKRNKDNLIFFISSFVSSLIQFLIVMNWYFIKSFENNRFQIESEKLFSFIYNVPVRSFFGSTIPKFLFEKNDIHLLPFFNLFIFALSLFFFIFLIIYIIKKKDFNLNLIFISFILISCFALFGSMYSTFVGGRYAVVPSVILIFLVLRIFTLEKNFLLKILSGILLLSSLIVGLVEFKYKSPAPNLLSCQYHDDMIKKVINENSK